jgi:hypothetical protein
VRPARTVDNSAVLVMPNVKVRMETQHSVAPLTIRDSLPLHYITARCAVFFQKLLVMQLVKKYHDFSKT